MLESLGSVLKELDSHSERSGLPLMGTWGWNRADPGVVSWWGHSRTSGTGSEQGSRKVFQLWVKIGTVSKLVVLLYFCSLPSNACSLYMNESQRPRPPFLLLPPRPLCTITQACCFPGTGTLHDLFFDVHTNNIIFKYYTHIVFWVQPSFGFLTVTFSKRKGNMLTHAGSTTFSKETMYHKFPSMSYIISTLFVIMAAWDFIVELLHNLSNHFLIEGHLVFFPQSLILHMILQWTGVCINPYLPVCMFLKER